MDWNNKTYDDKEFQGTQFVLEKTKNFLGFLFIVWAEIFQNSPFADFSTIPNANGRLKRPRLIRQSKRRPEIRLALI